MHKEKVGGEEGVRNGSQVCQYSPNRHGASENNFTPSFVLKHTILFPFLFFFFSVLCLLFFNFSNSSRKSVLGIQNFAGDAGDARGVLEECQSMPIYAVKSCPFSFV